MKLENKDFALVAEVIREFSMPQRQKVMQLFADRFAREEPRFDPVVFARECNCNRVDVWGRYIRTGNKFYGGIVQTVQDRRNGKILVELQSGEEWIFSPVDRILVYAEE